MIFNPYRVSTATVHVIYTLYCLSVLKYLYSPKLFLLHVTLLYKRKNAHKKLEQMGARKLKIIFLFCDYCLFVVLYKNNSS